MIHLCATKVYVHLKTPVSSQNYNTSRLQINTSLYCLHYLQHQQNTSQSNRLSRSILCYYIYRPVRHPSVSHDHSMVPMHLCWRKDDTFGQISEQQKLFHRNDATAFFSVKLSASVALVNTIDFRNACVLE